MHLSRRRLPTLCVGDGMKRIHLDHFRRIVHKAIDLRRDEDYDSSHAKQVDL